MKVTKYKNLYQLTWAPMLFPINCYLWENDDDIIVIDMGVKSFVSEIKKIAERLISGGGAGSGYERPGGCSDVQCQGNLPPTPPHHTY